MTMKRRGFLGGMGALFATTPEKVLKSVGVSETSIGFNGAPMAGLVSGAGENSASAHLGGKPWWYAEKLKLATLQAIKPDWFEKKRRANARYVPVLDVDIAAFQSVSPAAKINMQRERNYQQEVQRDLERYALYEAEENFQL